MKIKYIIIALIAIGIVGAAIGFYLYNKPQKDISEVKAVLGVDAQKLFSDFETDETSANEKYLGKVIEVKGEIVNINKLENGNVSIALVDEMFGVTCTIDSLYATKNPSQIAELSEGQIFTFKGKCDGMLTDVVLTQCIPINKE